MVVENFPNFIEWLLPNFRDSMGAGLEFIVICALIMLAGLFFGYIICAIRHGPSEGFYVLAKEVLDGIPDILQTSPRRTFAIAKLTIQESVRRRVLLAVFGIFAVSLLVGGWYLDVKSDHPDRLYIAFVIGGTQYLALALVLLLSAFSLPKDIKDKTIFTVVTKPVRASEIVMGRMIGFATIGTVVLLVLGFVSYFFVVRGVTHRHTISATDIVAESPDSNEDPSLVTEGEATKQSGRTSTKHYHTHVVTVDEDGHAHTDVTMGHSHAVTVDGEGEDTQYRVGQPEGVLQARVPVYASRLSFLDRQGNPSAEGINVGEEWTYRSYIAGGTLAAAIWRFEGVHPSMFDTEDLPIELNLRVYRSHKGEINRRILGELVIKHPTKTIESTPIVFRSYEYTTQKLFIKRKLEARRIVIDELTQAETVEIDTVDLYEELMDENGNFELVIQCAEPAQYFGMARADAYLRAKDSLFAANFAKGFLSLWLQMLVVTCFGVMFSTFLSSAISLMATVSVIFMGFNSATIQELAKVDVVGGGPIESFLRLITQKNMMVRFEDSVAITTMKVIDRITMFCVERATYTVPRFNEFNTSSYLAYGFNINSNLLSTHVVTGIAFFFCLTVVSYFLLKTREIAA